MATLQEFLDQAQVYLTAQDVSTMTRNELLAHGALEKMLVALKGGDSLDRFNMDVGALVRSAGQEKPWSSRFRVFYSDGVFTVPHGVTSCRIWVAGGNGSGAGPVNSNDAVEIDGAPGGTSSVIGPGIAISATGGSGGLMDGTGGAGGVGSGGDENYTGGAGGAGASDVEAAAGGGGGGSATPWGNGGKGGDGFASHDVSAAGGGGGSVFPGGDGSEHGSGSGASAYGAGVTPGAEATSNVAAGVDCIGGSVRNGVSSFPFNQIQKLHPFDGFWYAGGYGFLSQGNGPFSSGHGGAAGGARASNPDYSGEGGYAGRGPGSGSGAVMLGATQSNKKGGEAYGNGGAGGGGVLSAQYAATAKGGGGGGGGGFSRGIFAVTAAVVLNVTIGFGGQGHYNNGGGAGDGFVFIEYQ